MSATTARATLYSFRRCPYAMRARMAIASANITVALREVALRDKPAEMLRCSPKGTVPVLLLPTGEVIDESLDIMRWALRINDPERWLPDKAAMQADGLALIRRNDGEFKTHLDHYKYAVRHPEHPPATYRDRANDFLSELETRLRQHPYLLSQRPMLADIAILPFIRQFALVDKQWFDQSPYPQLQRWLASLLITPIFSQVMAKQPVYQAGDPPQLFPRQLPINPGVGASSVDDALSRSKPGRSATLCRHGVCPK